MVSRPGEFGHDQYVLAFMLTLPATLVGLILLLAITSGLERQLAKSVRPAHVRSDRRRLPAPSASRH